MSIQMRRGRLVGAAAGLAVLAAMAPAAAAPIGAKAGPAAVDGIVSKAQVGIYVGVGPRRPYYGDYHRPYPRYYGGYYRPYYYAPPPPPPVTYYETRPYVARSPRPYDPDAVARCASRFRSFDVDRGTYVTHDGEERLCPYLR